MTWLIIMNVVVRLERRAEVGSVLAADGGYIDIPKRELIGRGHLFTVT